MWITNLVLVSSNRDLLHLVSGKWNFSWGNIDDDSFKEIGEITSFQRHKVDIYFLMEETSLNLLNVNNQSHLKIMFK